MNDQPIGAGRIRYPKKDVAKIERLAVLKELRGQGIGKSLLIFIIDHLKDQKIPKVILDSQYQARGFYEKFGFNQIGDIFEEVGKPHIKMQRIL